MAAHSSGKRPKKFDPAKDIPPVKPGRERVVMGDPQKKSRKELKKEAAERRRNLEAVDPNATKPKNSHRK